LGRTQRAQQLRQALPLVTIFPKRFAETILRQASALKKGMDIGHCVRGTVMTREKLGCITRASGAITDTAAWLERKPDLRSALAGARQASSAPGNAPSPSAPEFIALPLVLVFALVV